MRKGKELNEILSALPGRGVYTLVVFLPEAVDLAIGELGRHRFPKGYYAYTGSAIGPGSRSLRLRVDRHLRKAKKKHWHIDYLLASEKVVVRAVVAVSTSQRLECEVNRLMKRLGGRIVVDGLGASDCRSNCGSHLLYFGIEEKVEFRVTRLYDENFGERSVALMLR